jgi:hypothetical protein
MPGLDPAIPINDDRACLSEITGTRPVMTTEGIARFECHGRACPGHSDSGGTMDAVFLFPSSLVKEKRGKRKGR